VLQATRSQLLYIFIKSKPLMPHLFGKVDSGGDKNKKTFYKKMKKKQRIMIVVGEISGDAHAAKLVQAMRKKAPDIDFEFFGATGKKMREIGVQTVVEADDFARVGIVEVATALPMFLKVFRKVKKTAVKLKPDLVVLIDFPDFNLKLATALKKRGFKIVYYISPQVWAWKQYRVKRIKKYVDLLLTILPFENKWFAEQGFEKTKYVGNPLAGEVKPKFDKNIFCKKHGLEKDRPIISLLPGSRRNEIEKILPKLIETAGLMSDSDPNLQFVIGLASIRKIEEVERAKSQVKTQGLSIPNTLITVKNETYELINASDVAAVTSGTATLETAIIGTPLAIVYQVSKLNYQVLRRFISVENFGLVNLIAEKKIAKEFIQDDFTAGKLSQELFRLLENKANQEMRQQLIEIKKLLGDGGASEKAAEAILAEIDN
jgi:lipid-A-disaccharide synthase